MVITERDSCNRARNLMQQFCLKYYKVCLIVFGAISTCVDVFLLQFKDRNKQETEVEIFTLYMKACSSLIKIKFKKRTLINRKVVLATMYCKYTLAYYS